jgi:hypothetical protein
MSYCKSSLLFLAFVMTLVLPLNTYAVSIAIDAEDLIERSEVIVTGKIVLKTGRKMNWIHRNFDDRIFNIPEVMTEYEIEVSRVLKGDYECRVITIYGFGGVVGDRETTWSLGFNFELGDNVLLFLHKDKENGLWTVVGQSQGGFKLERKEGSLRIISSVQEKLLVKGGEKTAKEHQRLQIKKLENLIQEKEK